MAYTLPAIYKHQDSKPLPGGLRLQCLFYFLLKQHHINLDLDVFVLEIGFLIFVTLNDQCLYVHVAIIQ